MKLLKKKEGIIMTRDEYAKKIRVVAEFFGDNFKYVSRDYRKGAPVFKMYKILTTTCSKRDFYNLDCSEALLDKYWELYQGDYMQKYKDNSPAMKAFQKIRYDYQHITKGMRDFI